MMLVKERNQRPLGVYTDRAGRLREVVCLRGYEDSTVVVDREALAGADARLVAHLAADEPRQNAAVVCADYMTAPTRGRCRRLEGDEPAPSFDEGVPASATTTGWSRSVVCGRRGGGFRVRPVRVDVGRRELRWVQMEEGVAVTRVVSLRDVVACAEDYEPARAATVAALAGCAGSRSLSGCVLRSELRRLDTSRVVLNRALREAALRAMARDGLTLNEIAIRCGRMKRTARGRTGGETSWLARRLGLAPEGGQRHPSPWIHSDVLALIARHGLGVDPYQVELG